MPTKYIKLRGKVKWCKCYEPDEYNGATRWITQFYPGSEEDWKKFKDAGLQQKVKDDEDGKFFTIRRDTKKLFGDDLTLFAPPKISGEVNVRYTNQNDEEVKSHHKGDGTIISRVGDPTIIANGSEAIVHLAVYDTKQGKGHRWESMEVLTLEDLPPREEPEMEPNDDDDDKPW